MLTARAFCMMRRSVGLEAGSAPPALTDMLMSLAMRANCFAMRFQRANMACLRTSNMRPMAAQYSCGAIGRGSRECEVLSGSGLGQRNTGGRVMGHGQGSVLRHAQ